MILRDRCSTSYDLASLFRGRRGTIAKRIGKFCRMALFLTLSSSKHEKISQNSFVFKLTNRQIDS